MEKNQPEQVSGVQTELASQPLETISNDRDTMTVMMTMIRHITCFNTS